MKVPEALTHALKSTDDSVLRQEKNVSEHRKALGDQEKYLRDFLAEKLILQAAIAVLKKAPDA